MIKFPKFYFHWYKDWRSYALVFSITTRNASIQFGPAWISVTYRPELWE